MPSKHSVVLVEDHRLVRAGLRALISDLPAFEIVGEAGDGETGLELVRKLQPTVLVTDISMPRLGGLELIAAVRAASPHTRILVLSMYDSRDFVMQALRAGASGYLLKAAAESELDLALDAVTKGEQYLSPAVSSVVISQAIAPSPESVPPAAVLTPRQTEILRLIALGRATKQIAFDLDLSVKTVETHRAQIMERLGLRDVASLTLYAVRNGLIRLDP